MLEIIGCAGLILLCTLIFLWGLGCFCKFGKLTLAPSAGTLRIRTGFRPYQVKVRLCGCPTVPGCSQIEDFVVVESMDCDGFVIRYNIQSGMRVVKWKACA